MLDYLNDDFSYIYGFYAGDGGLYNTTRNRGKFQTEIRESDKDILLKMSAVFKKNNIKSYVRERTRDTNFAKDYKSVSLIVHSLEFRNSIINAGFPVGNKTFIIDVPKIPFNAQAFVRGFIDADGSLCIGKSNDIPIVSIVISSENMYKYMREIVNDVCGYRPNLNRNSRDDVYNLGINRGNAIKFIRWLGYENEWLCLDRKKNKALELLERYSGRYEQQKET